MGTPVVKTGTLSATSGGTTDFTSSGFGTPSGAIVIVFNANSSNDPAATILGGIGFFDGTTQIAHGILSTDAQSTTDAHRDSTSGRAVLLVEPSASEYTASTITDGVRLTLSVDNTTVQRKATVILLPSDWTCDVHNLTPNATENNTVTKTGLSFAPDMLLAVTMGGALSDGRDNTALLAYGCAVNDGSQTQRVALLNDGNALTTTSANQYFDETSCTGQLGASGISWTGEITSFTSDGYVMTTRDGGTGGDDCTILAINTNGKSADLRTYDLPTSTGNDSVTGLSFEPAWLQIVATDCTAAGSSSADISLSIGNTDGTTDSSQNITSETGVGTSDTASQTDSRVVDKADPADNTDEDAATLVSFNADGYTLNFSASGGVVRKAWALAVEKDIAATSWAKAFPPRRLGMGM